MLTYKGAKHDVQPQYEGGTLILREQVVTKKIKTGLWYRAKLEGYKKAQVSAPALKLSSIQPLALASAAEL